MRPLRWNEELLFTDEAKAIAQHQLHNPVVCDDGETTHPQLFVPAVDLRVDVCVVHSGHQRLQQISSDGGEIGW